MSLSGPAPRARCSTDRPSDCASSVEPLRCDARANLPVTTALCGLSCSKIVTSCKWQSSNSATMRCHPVSFSLFSRFRISRNPGWRIFSSTTFQYSPNPGRPLLGFALADASPCKVRSHSIWGLVFAITGRATLVCACGVVGGIYTLRAGPASASGSGQRDGARK